MKRLLIIAALLAATAAHAAAPTPEQCTEAADLTEGALKWRQAGITEEVSMEYLRQ